MSTERKRKVCDKKDAENLAKSYIKGDVRDFVWTPSDKYAEYRSVLYAFRDAKREMQRNWNRIWSLCSANGLKLSLYAWHVMRGDATPTREREEFFRRKMIRFGSALGRKN